MNEEELLKKFAKALGAEEKLEEIEQKKIQQEKMLKGMAKILGTESLLEEIEQKKANEQALIDEKREKERKMLESMNAALARLVNNNPEHAEAIQQEVEETIEAVAQEEPITIEAVAIEEEEVVAENASQPQPELPKDDIITQTVKNISKAAPGEIQQKVDALPPGIRKELDILKKSIADLHRFATNHSQLGGGGEVKLARLDDVNASTIADGLYLRYDGPTNMFVFDTPAGGGGGGGSNGISITNATVNGNGSLIITYSNSATANAGYVIGPAGANGANGANGSAGANGADGIGITSSIVNGNGYLTITYSNSYVANAGYVVGAQGPAGANGANGATGNTGPAGADGANGISVTSANVNSNGYLIIGYSNSTTANAGYVVGPAGSNVSQIQSDWNQTNNTSVDFIKNKPTIPSILDDLSDVSIASPTNGQVLKYNGSYWYNGTDATGTGGGTATPGYYGSFLDDTTQTAALANTGYAMKYNTTVEANEVSVDNTHANTRVYVTYAGVYNIQFSAQIHNTGGGGAGKNVMIWLSKNGTAVPDSSTDVSCDTNTPYKVAAWNFVLTLNSGDYFELMWATDNTSIVLEYATNVLDGSPHIPSVILTVTQVAAILIPTDITGSANTANNANYLDGYHGNQYAFANSLTLYQTTAGLSANVATLTANAAGYLNGKTESNLNVNNALTSNAATYLNGKTESNLNVNNALTSNASTYLNGKTESNLNVNNSLTSNNASYLGGTIAANYVQNTDSRTLSGNLTFSGVNNYFSSIVYVGANNYMNATHHFISTNSTMNVVITANQITLNGANVITTATAAKIYYANGTQAYP